MDQLPTSAQKSSRSKYDFDNGEPCQSRRGEGRQGQRNGLPLQLAHRHAIEECDDVYYPFANHEDLARLVSELELPARRASRRMANLPYLSLDCLGLRPVETACQDGILIIRGVFRVLFVLVIARPVAQECEGLLPTFFSKRVDEIAATIEL